MDVFSHKPLNIIQISKSIIASSSLMNFFCMSCGIYFPICRIHEYGNSASCPIALHYREHILFFYSHPKCKPFYKGIRYGIPNQVLVGACFIPLGLGSMSTWIVRSYQIWSLLDHFLVGATIAGLISDRTVIWWRNKRKGAWYPEDRLRASLLPLALIVPLPVIAFGFINTFVDGSLGLLSSLLCLFINGVGVSIIPYILMERDLIFN